MQSAEQLAGNLNKAVGFNHFFTKKGKNPGTHKTKSRGPDFIQGTDDDQSIADFTQTPLPIVEANALPLDFLASAWRFSFRFFVAKIFITILT